MPLYYFHVHNSVGFVEDEEGRELPGVAAARAEALKGIRSLIAEDVLRGHVDLRGKLEVADEAGRILLTIAFADAVAVRS